MDFTSSKLPEMMVGRWPSHLNAMSFARLSKWRLKGDEYRQLRVKVDLEPVLSSKYACHMDGI
jgi:hypothetical protein